MWHTRLTPMPAFHSICGSVCLSSLVYSVLVGWLISFVLTKYCAQFFANKNDNNSCVGRFYSPVLRYHHLPTSPCWPAFPLFPFSHHKHVHVCVSVYVCVHADACAYVCVYVYACVHIHVSAYNMYIYVCVCVCVCADRTADSQQEV